MYYVFERTESEFAVLVADDKTSVSVPKSALYEDAEIGDVFLKGDTDDFIFDAQETAKRRKNAVSLHRSLFDKAKRNK